MSFVRKSVSNSRVNIKKSNLPVTFTETKKSSSVSSLNGIPSSAKNLPELTIIPIPKSSVSEMTDSLKSVRTARKSLNSQTLRQLPPGIQVIARTDSSKASFHSSVLSDTKKTTKNESQLTKIKGSSSKNVTNFQQKTNVSSDTNKTHVSSSLPQLIPKSSKKMYLEKNLYHGSKTDSEKKKIINSNGRIPASLLTSVDKGEVSIRNISNNDFSSNSEVLMNNEKNDVKYIQTVRGLSITEVGSKKITIATNNVKNKSMTNKPSETSRVINNAKMLNNNLMINRKQRNPSISSSGNLRKQMIISEVPGILINKTSTGRQAKLSINKNDDRNNIKTSNVNNQVDTNSNNSNDIYDIWKSDSSKKRRSKSTKKITPNPVLNTTESKSNKEPNFPVHSVKSTNSKNSTLQNKLNIFEKDVKKFDVQEPADQKQAIKRKSSETLPSNRPMKKPSPEMKSNGMLLQNSLKQRIQAINKSLKEFGSATIQEENKELASVNVTKDVSNISENASVSKPNISENTQTQINEKIEKYGETQLQELNLSPNADQDVSNISENASISKPKISENTQTQINEKIENYSETQLQELNLKSPNADQVAVDVKQKEAPTKKPCKQVTSPKLSLKRKGTNKNTTAKRPKISKNSKIKSVENKESKDILVPKDSLPWSEEDVLHTKYIKFLQFCLPFMKSSKSEEYKIIKRFGKLFKRTESIYLESIDFMNLLLQTVFKAKTDPGNIFLHLQVVSNELKNHKKIDLSGHISSSSDKLEFVKTSVSFTNGEHQSEFSKSKCTDSSISLSKPTEYTEPAASTSQSIALDEPIISTSKSTEPSKSGKSLPCISMESGEPVSSTSSLIKSTEFMASPSRSNVEPSALNEGEISNVYGDAEKKVEPSGNGKSNIIDESVVINVTPNMVKPNIIQNSFKSSITNESVEHSKTSESVEPNVTIPAEPSVTNVSVEPSVTNVFAEPSVANVSAESSVTVEPSVTNMSAEPSMTNVSAEPIVNNVSAEPIVNNVSAEPIVNNVSAEPIVNNVSAEPIVNNVSAEPSMTNVSTEPIVNNVSAEPIVNNVSAEPSVTNVSAEPSVHNVSAEPSVANVSAELSVANVSAELSVASVFAELREASAITEPSVVDVSIEPRVANVSAEPSVTNMSLEPSVTNVSAEPSVANVSLEPSMNNVSAEPGVTNVFTEPSESINPYITEDFIEYKVSDKFDSEKLKATPERRAEPENIGMIKQNAVILESKESNNSDEELSESLLKSIPKSTSTTKNVNIDEFYSRPSTSQQADYMEMLLAASHPGDTLDERKRGSYCKFSHEGFAKHSMDNSKYVPASKIIVENTSQINHSNLKDKSGELDSTVLFKENEVKSFSKVDVSLIDNLHKKNESIEKEKDLDSTALFNENQSKSTLKKSFPIKHKDPNSVEAKFERKIEKLENWLGKLDKKIRKLQTKELTLDDLDDEESIYIREDQYKRKFNQIWNLLCQYKKRSTLIGRKIEKRFHFEGSRYQSIDEAVERLVNKRKPYEKFPNYKEVLDLVKKKNEAEFLGLTSRDEEDLAADIFKEIGKELQRRRQLDVEEDLASYVPDNVEIEDDPADHDEELKSKLTKSAIDGEKKLNEILQEYVIKQRDEEKIQDDVMEVNETAESDNCDEMEETDPATPSTEERMDDSDDDCKSSKNAKFDQKPSPPKPNNVVSDVIEIGSSSDVSTEPGCELLESRKKEARREERSNLLTEQPVFISDEIEVIEVKNSEHDSSDSLPSLKEFIVI